MRRKMMILAVQLKFPSPKIKSIYRIKHNLSDRLLYHSQTKKKQNKVNKSNLMLAAVRFELLPIRCIPAYHAKLFLCVYLFCTNCRCSQTGKYHPELESLYGFSFVRSIGHRIVLYAVYHYSLFSSRIWVNFPALAVDDFNFKPIAAECRECIQYYKSCDNWKHEGRLKMGWNKFASAQAEYKASIDLLI